MDKYYPPQYKEKAFNCIHCGVYSKQHWGYFNTYLINGMLDNYNLPNNDIINFCICEHCKSWSYWYKERMIVPCEAPVSPAHVDMPEECLSDYNEARSIVALSPRGSAALIRLALQKLMTVLGEKGKNINDDIGSLVQKGLPIQVQQALDYCRVVGNNAVHPGEIELNDTPEIAHHLFAMINFIVEDRIARPKQIESLYSLLPEGAKEAIEKRDS